MNISVVSPVEVSDSIINTSKSPIAPGRPLPFHMWYQNESSIPGLLSILKHSVWNAYQVPCDCPEASVNT